MADITNRRKARMIQATVLRDYYARHFTIPNYTPSGWFECDVFQVTASGYFVEFEVKVDFQDFLADFDKRRERWSRRQQDVDTSPKHKQLAAASPRGPSRFWFVVPEEMEAKAKEALPPHAGLALWRDYGRLGRLRPSVQAPRLHTAKVDPAVEAHARGVLYWRFARLWLGAAKAGQEEPAG